MPDPLLLAYDIGTSGAKTSVVSAAGVILESHTTAYPTHVGAGGAVEQEPEDWWRAVCANTRAILGRRPEVRGRIAGIGVSGHMLCCLPIDEHGGPLRPCMIHSDTRSCDEAREVCERVGAAEAYEITGNPVDPRSPLCKLLWVKRHEPDVYANAWRFVQSKDYIVGQLTGCFDTTDLSDASHAQWLDLRRRAYAVDLFTALGLDAGKLPELHRGTDVVGKLRAESAEALGLPSGIPVVAGGGDGACATAGAGAASVGDTYCCIGTTAWIASVSPTPYIDPERRLFDIISLDGETCPMYGTVQSAGKCLQWIMDLLGEDFARLDDLLAAAKPGCEGLVFLPYLEGERSPIWDPNARGVFFGLIPAHGRAHLVRATLEGVSFALRSILDIMREVRPIPAMRLIGGGGRSQAWQRMLVDICDVPIEQLTTQSADATSLGAAMAAGVGVGVFGSIAEAAKLIGIARRHEPGDGASAAYSRQYEVYRDLYPRLKTAFAELAGQRAG